MSTIEVLLVILCFNSCDGCGCPPAPGCQSNSGRQLEEIHDTLNKINDKLDKLPGVGPHP